MALVDRLTIDLDLVKGYLKQDANNDDVLISQLITTAIEQADNYMQNDFVTVDEAGISTNLPIPVSITMACLRMIAYWYENRIENIVNESAFGISQTVGIMPSNARELLNPYRKLVGL